MNVKGTVYAINHERQMVAIKTDGGFTIIELLYDPGVELGDEISWPKGTALGGQEYQNVTKHCTMHVFVQDHWAGAKEMRDLLLR